MKQSSLLILVFVVSTAQAHPGIGIVRDSRGNVFFTDLKQVWKIAPRGEKTVAVPNVHTHELCLDADDHLYGEHLWYEGNATKKWGHRVWRLAADRTLTDVIPAREGFLNDDSFVRDRAGNRYWIDTQQRTVVKKRAADGTITTNATFPFRDPRWMTATPGGTLYLIDQGDLVRISSDGMGTTLVSRVSARNPAPSSAARRHYHMGLWLDTVENVYIAVPGERLVVKVDADGKVSIAARSTGGWSPSGGMFDPSGNLWLLEYSSTNAVRARRIDRQGKERIF